jgi:Zn-dependent peptidase ImmA (M78 family)
VSVTVAGEDAAQRSAVDSAVALWNAQGPLKLTRSDDAELPRLPVTFEPAAAAFRGVYDDERGIVIVNSVLSSDQMRAIIVAHELGHAFGLQHSTPSEDPSVMKADNVETAPTAGDVARLRTLWASCNTTE